MPEQAQVALANTTPLIALTAATGNLDVLRALYTRVIVPYEVAALQQGVKRVCIDEKSYA